VELGLLLVFATRISKKCVTSIEGRNFLHMRGLQFPQPWDNFSQFWPFRISDVRKVTQKLFWVNWQELFMERT